MFLTLVIGGFVGWLASILMKTDGRRGLLASIVAGAVGSFLGGEISNALGFGSAAPLGGIFIGMGGAAALIAVFLVLGVFDRRAPAALPEGSRMKHANFWVSILAMVASLATVCVIVMPPSFALKGLAWLTLALAAAGLSLALAGRRSPRLMAQGQVLQDVAAAPLPAVARTGRTNLASKGRETP